MKWKIKKTITRLLIAVFVLNLCLPVTSFNFPMLQSTDAYAAISDSDKIKKEDPYRVWIVGDG